LRAANTPRLALLPKNPRAQCFRELQEFFAPMAAFPLQLTLKSVLVDEEIMTTPGHRRNLLLANSQVEEGAGQN
jgi:hypothetical protein